MSQSFIEQFDPLVYEIKRNDDNASELAVVAI